MAFHKCFSACNGTLSAGICKTSAREEGLPLTRNSALQSAEHRTIDSRNLDFLNDNSRVIVKLRPKCCLYSY